MIRRLPEEVVRKIAAGEVVTGAFSVVKELVENSLDAGASRIDVEIRNGGKSYIRVRDDGCGMNEEEVLLAIQPHTTSKISTLEDLNSVTTYGFRGEALAAIVRVSRVMITTRRRDMERAVRVTISGGKVEKVEETEAPIGTTVIVKDLFFNIPARRKFLKSSSIEGRMVIETMQKFILARPDVHFTLVRDGQVIFNAPPSDLRGRVAIVMPEASPREMVELDRRKGETIVRGLVSRPGDWKKNRTGQFFFVNSRPVVAPLLSKALEAGYGEALPKGMHPYAVIFIELPPNLVDVNVHPQKIEVKFSKEEEVLDLVKEAVSSSIKVGWKRELKVPGKPSKGYEMERERIVFKQPQPALEIERSLGRKIEGETPGKVKLLAMLADRYILAEDDEGLLIVDYHAAHERILYEKLKSEYLSGKIPSLSLIAPIEVTVDEVLKSVALENSQELRRLGFEFREKGETLEITSVPSVVKLADVQDVFIETLEEMRLGSIRGMSETVEKILADMACKSAVRTGDRLDEQSAAELLKELESRNLLSCPHGRPLVFRITLKELDRFFGRA